MHKVACLSEPFPMQAELIRVPEFCGAQMVVDL